MKKLENNFAFIDSQNLNLGILDLGWKLDYQLFRTYLRERYGVAKAFVFIGYIEGNDDLYTALRTAGFICIFKPTLTYKDGTTKGNCDAELVLQAMIEYQNYDKAIIVTGDGDFYCLVDYLITVRKLHSLMIPNRFKYSALLKYKKIRPFLRFCNDLRERLEFKKKRPYKDGTL